MSTTRPDATKTPTGTPADNSHFREAIAGSIGVLVLMALCGLLIIRDDRPPDAQSPAQSMSAQAVKDATQALATALRAPDSDLSDLGTVMVSTSTVSVVLSEPKSAGSVAAGLSNAGWNISPPTCLPASLCSSGRDQAKGLQTGLMQCQLALNAAQSTTHGAVECGALSPTTQRRLIIHTDGALTSVSTN